MARMASGAPSTCAGYGSSGRRGAMRMPTAWKPAAFAASMEAAAGAESVRCARLNGRTSRRLLELGAEVVPGALEEIRVPELVAAKPHLLVGKDVRLADLQRHVLAHRIFLEIVEEHERLDDVLADRDRAVRLEERRRSVPERGSELIRHGPIVDRVRRIQKRHRVHQRALRVYGLIRLADHGEIGRPLRVTVDDRLDVRPHAIDAAVQVTLERRTVLARKLVRIEVD